MTSQPGDGPTGSNDEPDRDDGGALDPRLAENHGDDGIPATLVDTDHNMPGDQPIDSIGPNKSDLEGKPSSD